MQQPILERAALLLQQRAPGAKAAYHVGRAPTLAIAAQCDPECVGRGLDRVGLEC